MYYRYYILKDGVRSGLFHPRDEWNVTKPNGLYDVVRANFSTLQYIKPFDGKSESWFTEAGRQKFLKGIEALTEFYLKFKINVIMEEKEKLDNILAADEDQVWCEVKGN